MTLEVVGPSFPSRSPDGLPILGTEPLQESIHGIWSQTMTPEHLLSRLKVFRKEVERMAPSRELSMVLTKLDEARHWAKDMSDRQKAMDNE